MIAKESVGLFRSYFNILGYILKHERIFHVPKAILSKGKTEYSNEKTLGLFKSRYILTFKIHTCFAKYYCLNNCLQIKLAVEGEDTHILIV